jgi:hypothetical protein
MPGQNGFQLTRAITRDPRLPTCPSSCAPARTRKPTASGACARAPSDYVVKPVNGDELLAKIKAVRLMIGRTSAGGPDRWPTSEALRELQAAWPSACSWCAPRRASNPGWPSSAPARVCWCLCRRPGEIFDPRAPCCRCRTPSPGSWAWPTCAAACTGWWIMAAFLGLCARRCLPDVAPYANRGAWWRSTPRGRTLRGAGGPPGRSAQPPGN